MQLSPLTRLLDSLVRGNGFQVAGKDRMQAAMHVARRTGILYRELSEARFHAA